MKSETSATPPRLRIGSRVIRHLSASSTNDIVKQLLSSGEPHGAVVVATEQTGGRGQRGRQWASPPGGLYVSALLRPAEMPAASAGLLSIAAGVAAAEALTTVSSVEVALKWPNDLFVGNRKVGGILIETAVSADRLEWAIIGIGVNVNVPRGDLPVELRESATSLSEALGRPVSPDDFLGELCERLERLIGWWEAGQDKILTRWRALDTTVGRRVRSLQEPYWQGCVEAVDGQGRLVVRTREGRRTIGSSAGIAIE